MRAPVMVLCIPKDVASRTPNSTYFHAASLAILLGLVFGCNRPSDSVAVKSADPIPLNPAATISLDDSASAKNLSANNLVDGSLPTVAYGDSTLSAADSVEQIASQADSLLAAQSSSKLTLGSATPLPTLQSLQAGVVDQAWTWRRCVMTGPGGPIILDFRIRVDDHSLEKQIEEIRRHVHNKFLMDGKLSWESALSDPKIAGGSYSTLRPSTDSLRKQLLQMYDRNQDGMADERELHAYLTRGISERPILLIDEANRYRGQNRDSSPIFNQLDTNSDGTLDKNEIGEVPTRLTQLDSNADFQLSLTEVLPREADPDGFMRQKLAMAQDMFITLGENLQDKSLARILAKQYGSSLGLVRDDWPSTGPIFDKLDLNRDSQLDSREISQFGMLEPSMLIDLQYGMAAPLSDSSDSDTSRLDVRFGGDPSSVKRYKNGMQWTIAGHFGYRFEIIMDDPMSSKNRELRFEQLAAQLGVTKSKGATVESSSASPGLPELRSLDENQDGIVDWSELEVNEQFRAELTSFSVRIRFVEPPDLWFSWLDEDLDQILSEVELRNASRRLRQLTLSSEDSISPMQIPNQLVLIMTRVYGEQDPFRSVQLLGNRESRVEKNLIQNTPSWFTAMDSNGDSRITFREFLGKLSDFERLDQDSDGFISVHETTNSQQGDN